MSINLSEYCLYCTTTIEAMGPDQNIVGSSAPPGERGRIIWHKCAFDDSSGLKEWSPVERIGDVRITLVRSQALRGADIHVSVEQAVIEVRRSVSDARGGEMWREPNCAREWEYIADALAKHIADTDPPGVRMWHRIDR